MSAFISAVTIHEAGHAVAAIVATSKIREAARWRAERPNHSAPRIAASEEGVPAIFGGVVSLSLINSFATNRTKPNMDPPIAIPYIAEADTQSQRSMA
jgi:hypothetical protein